MIKKFFIILVIFCMAIGLVGCTPNDVSQYIFSTGTFLRESGNNWNWAVFVPSPTNPNWVMYGKINEYGVYYWATLSLEAGSKEIGKLAAQGWQWEQPNMMPGSLWVMMVTYVYAGYTALGLSDIFFVVVPKFEYHAPVIVPDNNVNSVPYP